MCHYRYSRDELLEKCYASSLVYYPDLGCYSNDLFTDGWNSDLDWLQYVLVHVQYQHGGAIYDTRSYYYDLNTRNTQT